MASSSQLSPSPPSKPSSNIPDISILLQDILSPSSTPLPSHILPLLSYHLSSCPLPFLTPLIHFLSTSPSLWKGLAQPYPSPPLPSSTSRKWSTLPFDLTTPIFNALVAGISYRSTEISKQLNGSTGYRARRLYTQFFENYFDGVWEEEKVHPVIRLVLVSAALTSLQGIKNRKEKLFVGGKALLGRAEKEVLAAWEDVFEKVGYRELRLNEDGDDIPSWLASQTLPLFTIDTLKSGPVTPLLNHLLKTYSSIFHSGTIFSLPSLSSDLHSTPTGLHWSKPSPSHTLLTSTLSSPLFIALGPLSRSIGRCIESLEKQTHSLRVLESRVKRVDAEEHLAKQVKVVEELLLNVSEKLERGWEITSWSDLVGEEGEGLDEETKRETGPWSLLKSYLFSLTLIHSSLLLLLTPSPSSSPTSFQTEMSILGLNTLGKTYFVAEKFGTEGFGAWRGNWIGLIEVLKRGASLNRGDEVERVLKELEPERKGVHKRVVERSRVTFYMNTAEQLLGEVREDFVKERVLPICYPYLENVQYRATFESAHSVLLAVFASSKHELAKELAPWYTKQILSAHQTNLLSTPQLRLAFTTLTKSLSSSDDALAWWCILQLLSSISLLPSTTSSPLPPIPSTSHSLPLPPSQPLDPHPLNQISTNSTLSSAPSHPPTTPSSKTSDKAEDVVLSLPSGRGPLLLTLVDQLTVVNLILFETLLEKIEGLVREEREEEGRRALGEVVFRVLESGLDAGKKGYGTGWWMRRGEGLVDLSLKEEEKVMGQKEADEAETRSKGKMAPSNV